MDAYANLMQQLQGKHRLVMEHRQQLFGHVIIDAAPDRFWELKAIHALPGGKVEWDQMSLGEQEERKVFLQLENMIATLDAHYRLVEHNLKLEESRHARTSRKPR